MDCISCANSIKKTILRKMGENIEFLDIDFQSQKMFVKLKDISDINNIIKEIKNLGYEAILDSQIPNQQSSKKELINLISAICLSSFVFIVSMFFHDLLSNNYIKSLVLVCSTIVQFINGYKFYRNVFYSLKNRILNMDLLVVISTTTAYFYSLYNYLLNKHDLYFETSSIIISIILLGRYIEESYKKKGFNSILNLLTFRPQEVNIYKNGSLISTDVNDIKEGDLIELYKGQSVPVDGKIIEGEGIFDLNLLFGENEPVKLKQGETVLAGSLLIEGIVKIQATSDYKSSFWKGIENSIYKINTQTSNYQRFIDKLSGNFVIIIVFLALSSFIYWYFVDNIKIAINSLISTLIIACPCAIGLASPLAINKGMMESAKKQIIVKDPYVFEKIHKAKNFVFDKTGTITNKNIKVNQFIMFHGNNFELAIKLALLVSSKSKHPLSVAIKDYIQSNFKYSLYKLLKEFNIQSYQEITSLGIIAKLSDGKILIIGNKSLLEENNISIDEENYNTFIALLEEDRSLTICAVDTIEEINPGVKDLIDILEKTKKNLFILTGANKKSAIDLARQINIDINKIMYSVNAFNKVKVIEEIKKNGVTVFIGDGINDSVAMNFSDVGISFEYGSDITQNSASVILKNIAQLKDLISISAQVFKKLRFNIFWVFGYNVLLVPIAMGFLHDYGIMVNPMLAALAMVLSDFSLLFFNLSNLKIVK